MVKYREWISIYRLFSQGSKVDASLQVSTLFTKTKHFDSDKLATKHKIATQLLALSPLIIFLELCIPLASPDENYQIIELSHQHTSKANAKEFEYFDEIACTLLLLEFKLAHDILQCLFEFGSTIEVGCDSSFKHVALFDGWARKPLLNDKSSNRARAGDERNFTGYLPAFHVEVLTFTVAKISERDSLRNDCAEVDAKVSSDGIKWSQFAIEVADRNFRGTSIMHLIQLNYGPASKHSLSHGDVHAITETHSSIQVKNTK